MAKLIVVCLVYVVAVALTSCSASRPLVTAAVSSPDLTHSTTRKAPSLVVPTKSESSSITTESQDVPAEHDGQLTKSDSEELVDDLGPCMEEEDEEVAAEERACHRMLRDYGPPTSNPDVQP